MKETDINKWTTLMIERIQSLSGKDGWKKPWFTEGVFFCIFIIIQLYC